MTQRQERLFVLELSGDGRVFSVNPDGTDKKVIVTGCRYPDGVAVDVGAGHIYWTNMGSPPVNDGSIERVDDSGIEVPQGETGEIVIRGHNVMKGYWQRPEATSAAIRNGWFHTEDLARVDPDGYFWIVGRQKDLIIRGGYNVYPREVEDVLYEHPAVADAAVIGLPNPDLGEEIGAAVVLKPGAAATAQELRDYLKRQVAAYEYPRKVWIVDALPKGPTGKILKREIVPPADGQALS
ncbi:AMP-binding protein [Streptomyces sp. NPDC007971]|uniref:AMP-binding enzyme n=1 Tax=Streptomyces sp. NPDC007971 TaxID=3364799 RepID=UPI0036EA9F9A